MTGKIRQNKKVAQTGRACLHFLRPSLQWKVCQPVKWKKEIFLWRIFLLMFYFVVMADIGTGSARRKRIEWRGKEGSVKTRVSPGLWSNRWRELRDFNGKSIMNWPSFSKKDMYLIWGMLTTRAFSTKWLLLGNQICYMFTCNLGGWTVLKQLCWSYTNKCITSLLCILQTAAFKKQS